MSLSRILSRRALVLALLGVMTLHLTACRVGISPVNPAATSAAGTRLQGNIHGGQQPVAGAAVYLYAAGTAGYGSSATSLLNTTNAGVLTDTAGHGYVETDADGQFTITGDYQCPAGSLVYLLALGGNPGLTSGATNPDLALMAALGPCSSLLANAATTFTNVNEVTTVASVWALSPFMSSATNVGTSSAGGSLPGNASGLASAFATVNNLVNIATGLSPGAGQPLDGGGFAGLPTGVTIPSTEIYTLANILASCINSDPSASSNCSTLFSNAQSADGTAPANTVEAALNIAKNPGVNVGALYLLATGTPPFTSGLSAAPNDWTMTVKYSGGGISTPNNIAIDASGNLWAANNGSATAGITVLSPTGSRISGTTAFTSGGLSAPFGIAIDSSGNGWATDTGSGKGGLTALNIGGTPLSGSPYTGGGITTASSPHGVALDASGNVWVTNQTGGTESLNEFSSSGVLISGPIQVGGITSTSQPFGIAIDAAGFIWVTNRGTNTVSKLTSTGTAATGSPYSGNGISNAFNVAFDSSGSAWISNFGGNSVTKLSSSGSNASGSPYSGGGQMVGPAFLAVDGLDNVWIADFSTSGTASSSCITELSNSGTLLSPVCYAKGANPNAHGLAIDSAGDLWVGGAGGVTQIVGIAAPVITPLATARTGGQLGVRP